MMINSQNSRSVMEKTRVLHPTRLTRPTYTTPAARSQSAQNVRSSRVGPTKFGIAFWLITALFASVAHATKARIYTASVDNTAVSGYDVVSYFQDDGKPIKGETKFKTSHDGADWLFASQENLEAFTNNPEKYQPQFGGYCAFSVARGSAIKGSPLHYHLSDGKLYLNLNARLENIWLSDKETFIEKGNKKWPDVLK